MAAGFKTAQVDAGSVPATQTSFPSYVDLSRLGITTLAEAQSVRVYADSGKTTEWAREIVSATEMHVKIPSLTSTTDIYVDWDGTSSDYAATDTYGRNAVWDSGGIYHLESTTDSNATADVTETNGVTAGAVAGQIGNGTEFDGTNDVLNAGNNFNYTTTLTISAWVYFDAIPTTQKQIVSKWTSVTSARRQYMLQTGETGSDPGKIRLYLSSSGNYESANKVVCATSFSANTWYLVHAVYDGANSDGFIYLNGSLDGSNTSLPSSIPARTSLVGIGAYQNASSDFSSVLFAFDGKMDEVRIRNQVLSANWITTEYNNQSDEAGFWGTWSDVGGAPTNTTNFFLMM